MRLVSVYESTRCRSIPTSDGTGFALPHELAGFVTVNRLRWLRSPAPSDWPVWACTGMNTAFVARDRLVLVPPLSVAVSRTLIVWPRSGSAGVYCDPVAPGISLQFAPAGSQRSHWRCRLGLSTQTSASALSGRPSAGTPSMNGLLKAQGRSEVQVAVTPAH